jgi:hypothetical protein
MKKLTAFLSAIFMLMIAVVISAQPADSTAVIPALGSGNVLLDNFLILLAPLILPFLTQGAVWVANKITSTLPSWIIPTIVVPVIAALLAWVGTLTVAPNVKWFTIFIIGLAGSWVRQVVWNLRRPNNVTSNGQPAK